MNAKIYMKNHLCKSYLSTALKIQAVNKPIIPGIEANSLTTKYGTIWSTFFISPCLKGSQCAYMAKMEIPVRRHISITVNFKGTL